MSAGSFLVLIVAVLFLIFRVQPIGNLSRSEVREIHRVVSKTWVEPLPWDGISKNSLRMLSMWPTVIRLNRNNRRTHRIEEISPEPNGLVKVRVRRTPFMWDTHILQKMGGSWVIMSSVHSVTGVEPAANPKGCIAAERAELSAEKGH